MGFVYKTQGRDRIMYEREDIIAWRERYLRKIMEIRKSVSPKAFLKSMDETWLNEGHRTRKEWTDLTTLGRKNLRLLKFDGLTLGCTKDPVGKGKRLISHAMTEQGPVNGALWIFPADSKKTKRDTNEEGDSVSGSGPGDTKKKKT